MVDGTVPVMRDAGLAIVDKEADLAFLGGGGDVLIGRRSRDQDVRLDGLREQRFETFSEMGRLPIAQRANVWPVGENN